MDSFQVLAWDPGGSTGWAHFEYKGTLNWSFNSGTLNDKDHHTQIRHSIEGWGYVDKTESMPLTVITESFEYRQDQRKGLELISREYIGVMKLICADLCVPLVQQSPGIIEHYGKPSTAKGFMNYEKLRRVGQLYEPLEANRHRHDALQHLLYYLLTKPRVEELREKIKRV